MPKFDSFISQLYDEINQIKEKIFLDMSHSMNRKLDSVGLRKLISIFNELYDETQDIKCFFREFYRKYRIALGEIQIIFDKILCSMLDFQMIKNQVRGSVFSIGLKLGIYEQKNLTKQLGSEPKTYFERKLTKDIVESRYGNEFPNWSIRILHNVLYNFYYLYFHLLRYETFEVEKNE
jgi:hypothetical protein